MPLPFWLKPRDKGIDDITGFREAMDIQRRTLGPEQPDTLVSASTLATVLRKEGRYYEAEKLSRDTLAVQRKVLGESHPNCASSTYNLAAIAVARHQTDQAFALFDDALNHGLSPGESLALESDPDLNSLHGAPRFDALVKKAQQHAATFAPQSN